MRITVSHNKTQAEMVPAVDRAINEVFKTLEIGPIKVMNPQKDWNGSTMNFSLTASMGFMKAPIVGTVAVTEKDVTIDADLGFLEKFITPHARGELETRVKGLLT